MWNKFTAAITEKTSGEKNMDRDLTSTRQLLNSGEFLGNSESLGITTEVILHPTERMDNVYLNAHEVRRCKKLKLISATILCAGGIAAQICSMKEKNDNYYPSQDERMISTITAVFCFMGAIGLLVPTSRKRLPLSVIVCSRMTGSVAAIATSIAFVAGFTTEQSLERGVPPYLGLSGLIPGLLLMFGPQFLDRFDCVREQEYETSGQEYEASKQETEDPRQEIE